MQVGSAPANKLQLGPNDTDMCRRGKPSNNNKNNNNTNSSGYGKTNATRNNKRLQDCCTS